MRIKKNIKGAHEVKVEQPDHVDNILEIGMVNNEDENNVITTLDEVIEKSVSTKTEVDQKLETGVETERSVATKIEEEEEFQKLVKYVSEYSLRCIENDVSQFKCNLCGETFGNPSQHVALYHCNITYPCSLCDKFI